MDVSEIDERFSTITNWVSDEQIHNGDIESPNDMLVDSDEFVNGAETEKDDGDVAIIHPDENVPRADDCMYLPCSPDAVEKLAYTLG